MKRNLIETGYAGPFVLWTGLLVKTNEMLWAAAQVIAYRTLGMVRAGPTPSSTDRREFALMHSEKIEATAESAGAMAAYMGTMGLEMGMLMMNQMMTVTRVMLTPPGGRTAGHMLRRQADLMGTATHQSARTVSKLSTSAARLAQRGLGPIHSRATSNAKRLAKR